MANKDKDRIYRKVLLAQVIVAILSIALVSAVVIELYINEKTDSMRETTFNYTRGIAEYIDGDKVEEYYKTKKTDEYYFEIQKFIDSLQNNARDFKYTYVIVPEDEGVTYIWDADVDNGNSLGFYETYSEGGKEIAEKTFKKDPEEEWLEMDDDYGHIAAAYSPVFNSAGDPVALVGVDFSVPGFEKKIIAFIIAVAGCIIIVNSLTLIENLHFINKVVVKPITVLRDATQSIVSNLENDENVAIDIHSHDEIDSLARDFEQMQAKIKDYLVKLNLATAEKERISMELKLATQIQTNSLPKIFPHYPECTELDLFADMNPAKEVGGDFYDFFWVDEDHFAIVIADVSGKGVPAALFMMISKVLIKSTTQLLKDTGETLTEVNNRLLEGNEASMFVTLWLGILDVNTGLLQASNAGHEFPVIKRKDSNFELFKEKHNMMLGAMEGIKYATYEIQLNPGDVLFVYTDGVPEATASSGEMFGLDRMLTSLNRDREAEMETILKNVKADIDDFAQGEPQFDDITLLSMKFNGRN